MIIQNTSTNQGAPPVRHVSNDVPVAVAPKAVADTAKQAAPQQPSPAQLQNAVDSINLVMRQSNQNLEFSLEPNTQKPIIRMVDTETGQLIRQIPSEEMLEITRSIDQFMQRQGLLLNQKA